MAGEASTHELDHGRCAHSTNERREFPVAAIQYTLGIVGLVEALKLETLTFKLKLKGQCKCIVILVLHIAEKFTF